MKKKKRARLSDLIPNEELRKDLKEDLYSGKPLLGPQGIFTELLQDLVNASLEGELDHHLAQGKGKGEVNRRNGHISKSVKSSAGLLDISTPRDRNSSFEPQIVSKRERELKGGLEELIMALYAQGNSNEDIHRMLEKIYGIDYSTSAISRITDRVLPQIVEWQQRPLQACYVILFLDGIFFRVREDGQFVEKTLYSVYGVDINGQRDVLGLYMDKSENAQDWIVVLEDLQKRGVQDVFFACIDGLPGFKEAIHGVFEKAIVQRCIVHKVRNSVRYAAHKEYKAICSDLRKVYSSANREQASAALDQFEQKWEAKGQRIAELWRKDWDELMAFMDYSQDLRRMIYTTNPIEGLHRIIRKVIKSKGAWVSERALTKQLFLALQQNEKSWKRKAYKWKPIQEQLEVKFGQRFTRWMDKA